LTVKYGTPVIALSASAGRAIVGAPFITGYTISSTGATVSSYSIAPALPAGLTFNTTTGLISGTPTVAIGSTTYTITATNSVGSTTATYILSAQFSAPAFALSSSSGVAIIGTAFNAYRIVSTGGAIASFTILPALPAGLTFDTTTGLISGTPTATSAATTYVITANNSTGSTRASYNLATKLIAPEFIVTAPPAGGTGSSGGGTGSSGGGTGSSGGGTGSSGGGTGSSGGGTGSSGGGTGPTVNISISSLRGIVGVPFNGYNIASTGGAISYYSIAPALSAGLSFNKSTGLITGAPTAVASSTSYTLTGFNAIGSASVTFTLTVISVTYTLTFKPNGGSAVASPFVYTPGPTPYVLPTPVRAAYTFNGWFDAATGGKLIGAGGEEYTPTASATLYGQWTQNSLAGLTGLRQISTLTTTAGVGTTFTASAGTTRVSIKYEADSLPVNSVVTVYLHGDLSQSAALLDPSANILLSVVVAWLATDTTVPTATTPLTVTINNPGIAIGAQVYTHSGNTLTLAGTATVGGQVVLSISDDPEIFIANPIKTVSKRVNNRKVFVRQNALVMKALVLSNRSKYCSHFA
jgi:hypothetical protein